MAGCKDILVNIADYNPDDTYTVVVKTLASIGNVDVLPSYTQQVTGVKDPEGPQAIFRGLPEGEYQVCIKRKCATGGVSPWSCQEVIDPQCTPPTGFEIDADSASDGITGTTAAFRWDHEAGMKYQYSVDGKEWEFTDTEGELELTGLTAATVYEIRLRKLCSNFIKSIPVAIVFATDTADPSFEVRIIDKVCEGTELIGFRTRFSFTGGIGAEGKYYEIKYTDFYGDEHILFTHNITGSDTDLAAFVRSVAATFNPVRFLSGSNFAAFDVVTKQQQSEPGEVLNCQDYVETTAFTATIDNVP